MEKYSIHKLGKINIAKMTTPPKPHKVLQRFGHILIKIPLAPGMRLTCRVFALHVWGPRSDLWECPEERNSGLWHLPCSSASTCPEFKRLSSHICQKQSLQLCCLSLGVLLSMIPSTTQRTIWKQETLWHFQEHKTYTTKICNGTTKLYWKAKAILRGKEMGGTAFPEFILL